MKHMSASNIARLTNRSLLRLSGADTKVFLQNLVSNDLALLSDTKAIYSALLTPQGKFLHDFFLFEWQGDIFVECLSDRKADLVRRLTMYKLRANVTIADASEEFTLHAIFGPAPDDFPKELGELTSGDDHVLYADPRMGSLGYRAVFKKDASWADNFTNCTEVSFEDYTAHRLSLGVPEGGTDIVPEKSFLLEANFEELHGVSFSKGCYVGQELTARTKYRAKIKKRIFTFKYDGELVVGDSIKFQDTEVAVVAAFQAPFGLAFTRLKEWNKFGSGNVLTAEDGLQITKPDYVILPDLSE